ncbi:pyocin activator PrtN family protein [Acidovorax sp. SUPP2539]|uniref:pyocin activator PrtN family protein n=1 Tax=Acidovorax sp. SUPP2539 TaxID=2920878 RepID=UPI0023DE1CEC|nr:pyocin activator PrtN family protein [Acidovorax sp. SUPP2539]GKS92261.1 pyocin activator PrtN family protein [Acidovorax sp. SUPP2539]
MNTFFALMAEYGTAQIPVQKCAALFGLSARKAEEYARRQELPVPAFRVGSQKSPWLVDAQKLAEHLDAAKKQAQTDWERMRA